MIYKFSMEERVIVHDGPGIKMGVVSHRRYLPNVGKLYTVLFDDDTALPLIAEHKIEKVLQTELIP